MGALTTVVFGTWDSTYKRGNPYETCHLVEFY